MDRAQDPALPSRMKSVDVGRGYCMLLLIAQAPLLRGLAPFRDTRIGHFLTEQLSHSVWHGMTYLDVGFPAFITAMGMAIPLSLCRRRSANASRLGLYATILRRSFLLFALGVFCNGGLLEPWPDVRVAGVLQRIALCYCLGAIIYLNCGVKSQVIVLAIILLGYWMMLAHLSAPGHRVGDYSFEGNLAAYVDRWLLPGRPYFGDGQWDPEGILSTVGAVATCLIGVLATQFLQFSTFSAGENAVCLLLAGLASFGAGYLWAEWLPINKPLWTSSYVLAAAGLYFLHFAVFYQICDVWKKNWLQPLAVVGTNSIVAYVLVAVVPLESIARRVAGSDVERVLGVYGPLAVALTEILLCWILLYWLYRRGIVVSV